MRIDKYTPKQLERTFKKLAKAYGYWNCPDIPDRQAASNRLHRETFKVIRKTGMFDEYQKEIQRAWRTESRKKHGTTNCLDKS